jgi:hypothetical protein
MNKSAFFAQIPFEKYDFRIDMGQTWRPEGDLRPQDINLGGQNVRFVPIADMPSFTRLPRRRE